MRVTYDQAVDVSCYTFCVACACTVSRYDCKAEGDQNAHAKICRRYSLLPGRLMVVELVKELALHSPRQHGWR